MSPALMRVAAAFGRPLFISLAFAFALIAGPLPAAAAESGKEINGAQVLEAFDRKQAQKVDAGTALGERKKHLIMFSLGVPLLLLLLTTIGLGIAMAVFGKQVFVMHMVMAGLTATLALVHVIVGLVWFYPF